MKTMGNVFVSETPHAQNFPSLVSQIDRLLHTLNEAHPVPLQVIKSGLDIVSFILSECKSYSLFASCFSLSASITEITGILAEVYLLTSICLPATSLLLRPSLTFGVTPADKLLLNVAYLQLFTFPLLAWGDIRSAFAAVLRCAAASPALRIAPAVPARVAAAFSVLYFIYDNSVLNVTPDAESLCDRTATPSAATRISEGFRLKDGAVAMGVNPEHLRAWARRRCLTNSLVTRMIDTLGAVRPARRNLSIVVGAWMCVYRSSGRPCPSTRRSNILRYPKSPLFDRPSALTRSTRTTTV